MSFLGTAASFTAPGLAYQGYKALKNKPFDAQYESQNYLDGPQSETASALQRKLESMQAPGPIAAYQAKDMSKEALPQYDQARAQTTQSLNAQEGNANDAMNRRFAAMGGGPSGAAVKAGMQQEQAAGETRANAMNQIGQQEAQARTALQQKEEDRAFQSGESTKQFNAKQAMENNQFQFDSNSKIAGLDLEYKKAQQESADSRFNAAMAAYNAQHSGGLLGSGGFLGTGIGI